MGTVYLVFEMVCLLFGMVYLVFGKVYLVLGMVYLVFGMWIDTSLPSPREPLQTLDTRLRSVDKIKLIFLIDKDVGFQNLSPSRVDCRESAAYQRTHSANDTTLNRLKSALVSCFKSLKYHFNNSFQI